MLCVKRERGVLSSWEDFGKCNPNGKEAAIWLTNKILSYIREKNFALKSASVELSTPRAQGRRGLEFILI